MVPVAATTGVLDHAVVHEDAYAYSAHPHLAVAANGDWLLVFTQSRRRAGVLHPPQDPLYCNMLTRSADEGRTWSTPSVVPGFGWQGVECAGLTVLQSGAVLLNQWRFGWHPLSYAKAHLPAGSFAGPDVLVGQTAMAAELSDWAPDDAALATLYPWARGGGETWVHRSEDHGVTFTQSSRIDTGPYSGGYGMRGGVEIAGEIVLPLSDVPNYARVFAVRSADGGNTWTAPTHVAAAAGREFEEPAPLLLRSGELLLMLRDNVSRVLHLVRSADGGRSWSDPTTTGIADYPASLVELGDGRIVCVAGRRQTPYGITLYVSHDRGGSWNGDPPLKVRTGLPNRDLGYPTAALRNDGDLFVAYYEQSANGITGIHATVVSKAVLNSAGRND